MKPDKDIFHQFREQSEHLEVQPSDQAWARLQGRLQQEKPVAKRRWLQQWAVAASLLLVLGAISILSTFLMNSNEQYAELELEDSLTPTVETSQDIYQLQRQYAKASVNEGTASKKLVAAVKYFYDEPVEQVQPSASVAAERVEEVVEETLVPISFDWLLGDWKGSVEAGTSTEKWQKEGDDLYGQGALEVAGKVVFTERMRLTKRGDQWFYILQLDPYAEPAVYALKQTDDQKMIFKNRGTGFPAQVVLLRNTDGSFSTQLLADDYIELSSTQLDFLTKRNVLLVDKAVRNLVKK
ncbi:MAG: DUF6265 family protein [Bacteroidota bacterium]